MRRPSRRSSIPRHLQRAEGSHLLSADIPGTTAEHPMEIDENAPGNQSQQVVTRTTDNETGHGSQPHPAENPSPSDDDAVLEEDMSDVDAADSVASEHPDA